MLGFGISFWQAAVAGLIGIVVSFLLCGSIAIAGKRGSAPTLILSRAAFGVAEQAALDRLLDPVRRLGDRADRPGHAATATMFQRLGWAAAT